MARFWHANHFKTYQSYIFSVLGLTPIPEYDIWARRMGDKMAAILDFGRFSKAWLILFHYKRKTHYFQVTKLLLCNKTLYMPNISFSIYGSHFEILAAFLDFTNHHFSAKGYPILIIFFF